MKPAAPAINFAQLLMPTPTKFQFQLISDRPIFVEWALEVFLLTDRWYRGDRGLSDTPREVLVDSLIE